MTSQITETTGWQLVKARCGGRLRLEPPIVWVGHLKLKSWLSMCSDYPSWSHGFQSPLSLQFLFISLIILAAHTLVLTSRQPERQHHWLTSRHCGCCPGPWDWLAILVDFVILQVNCHRHHVHHLPPPPFLTTPCLHSLLSVVSRYVFLQVCPSFSSTFISFSQMYHSTNRQHQGLPVLAAMLQWDPPFQGMFFFFLSFFLSSFLSFPSISDAVKIGPGIARHILTTWPGISHFDHSCLQDPPHRISISSTGKYLSCHICLFW